MYAAAQERMMLQEFPQIPGGPAGAISVLATAVIGGILWLRGFLSRDLTRRSTDSAYKEAMESLRAQITFSRARADTADARADAERARADRLLLSLDAATEQLSHLRAQVADLSRQVEQLKSQLSGLSTGMGPI